MAASSPRYSVRKTLQLQPLSSAAFAPFGDIIEPAAAGRHYDINEGLTHRYDDVSRARVMPAHGSHTAACSHQADLGFSIFRASPVALPFTLRRLERHPLGTQAFINTCNVAYAIVVAPPGAFDRNALRAFLAAPGQSINYHAGTWHHYLLALARADFVVLDRIGDGNCEDVELADPVTLIG